MRIWIQIFFCYVIFYFEREIRHFCLHTLLSFTLPCSCFAWPGGIFRTPTRMDTPRHAWWPTIMVHLDSLRVFIVAFMTFIFPSSVHHLLKVFLTKFCRYTLRCNFWFVIFYDSNLKSIKKSKRMAHFLLDFIFLSCCRNFDEKLWLSSFRPFSIHFEVHFRTAKYYPAGTYNKFAKSVLLRAFDKSN